MSARRPGLLPLVPAYWAGLAAKNALYDAGLLPVRRLRWPVISVGSLSAGGAGKTPVVKLLARLLEARGVSVDVLSRGYGRATNTVEAVEAAGDAARFGDEPLEMARAGLRVYVGAERYQAGRLAEAASATQIGSVGRDVQNAGMLHSVQKDTISPGVHVLDDGFQHRRLARALDIVVLTRQDAEDTLLPAGNLREPLASLRRAQIVVLREDEADGLIGLAGRYGAAVWVVRRRLALPESRPAAPLAFCGIARPEGFLAMLPTAGTVAFADHHLYGAADVQRLVVAAQNAGADGFVTTAKDAVKLGPDAIATLEAVGPVAVAELDLELIDEEAAIGRLLAAVVHGGLQVPDPTTGAK